MADRKTVYMCNGTRVGVVYTDPCKAVGGLSIGTDGKGTVALVPVVIPPRKVTVKLLKEGDSVNNVIPAMAWELVSDGNNSTPPYWFVGVRIHGLIPQACDWMISRVKSQFNILPILTQEPIPAEIPSSKEQALPSNAISTITTAVVPGERIWIDHDYRLTLGNGTAMHYFRTLSLTGGVVVDKWPHATIPDLFVYDVEIEGTVYYGILPTDFYAYSVDDFVFVLLLNAVSTSQARETIVVDKTLSGTMRIAPYNIRNQGVFPSIKSYGDTEFTRWSNMRFLPATINSTNRENNTATVTLNGTVIPDIPITYYCQQQSMQHGAKAFRPNDTAVLAFDGYRETVDSGNSAIIGIANLVRRCLSGLFLAGLYQADGTDSGTGLGNWLLDDGQAQAPDAGLVCGNNYWTNGTYTISWQTSQYGRYFYGNNSYGNTVYMYGSAIAQLGTGIAGAMIRTTTEGVRQVVVISADNRMFYKPVLDGLPIDGGWVQIPFVNSGYIPDRAVSFNASGTAAVSLSGLLLLQWSLIGDTATFWTTVQAAATDANNWSKPVAVDYRGDELVVATLTSQEVTFITETNGSEETVDSLVLGDPPARWLYVKKRDYLFDNPYEKTVRLEWNGYSEVILHEKRGRTQSGYFLYGKDIPSAYEDNELNKIFVGTNTYYVAEVNRKILQGIDLRNNLLACFEVEVPEYTRIKTTTGGSLIIEPWGSFTPVGTFTDYYYSPSISFSRSKKLNGQIVADRSAVICENVNNVEQGYKWPQSSDVGFDPVQFTVNTTASYSIYMALPLNPITDAVDILQDLSAIFLHASRPEGSMTSWGLSKTEAYTAFTGGGVAGLIGATDPVFAKTLKVV